MLGEARPVGHGGDVCSASETERIPRLDLFESQSNELFSLIEERKKELGQETIDVPEPTCRSASPVFSASPMVNRAQQEDEGINAAPPALEASLTFDDLGVPLCPEPSLTFDAIPALETSSSGDKQDANGAAPALASAVFSSPASSVPYSKSFSKKRVRSTAVVTSQEEEIVSDAAATGGAAILATNGRRSSRSQRGSLAVQSSSAAHTTVDLTTETAHEITNGQERGTGLTKSKRRFVETVRGKVIDCMHFRGREREILNFLTGAKSCNGRL